MARGSNSRDGRSARSELGREDRRDLDGEPRSSGRIVRPKPMKYIQDSISRVLRERPIVDDFVRFGYPAFLNKDMIKKGALVIVKTKAGQTPIMLKVTEGIQGEGDVYDGEFYAEEFVATPDYSGVLRKEEVRFHPNDIDKVIPIEAIAIFQKDNPRLKPRKSDGGR